MTTPTETPPPTPRSPARDAGAPSTGPLPHVEAATAAVRTSVLTRHGIHRLRIVSASGFRSLLEKAGKTRPGAVHVVQDRDPALTAPRPQREKYLQRIGEIEGVVDRMSHAMQSFEGALLRLGPPLCNARSPQPLPAVACGSLPPLEVQRLALLRAMLHDDLSV